MSGAPLALTMGDPAGIGLELALAAWREGAGAPFFLLADPDAVARIDRRLGLATPIETTTPALAAQVFAHALPVVALAARVLAEPGRPDPACAPAILESISRAVGYVHSGEASAVVTNPIAKKTLYDAGFRHPGHTEYLGELAAAWGAPATPAMMIWSPLLAVVPVTIHIPLAEAPRALTRARIEATARIVDRDLRARFRIERPRIAVAGLNPHAGEGGAMGREEIDTIAPAIATLRAEGLDIFGPLPADTMFHARARENYDVALTMYHDQGLIPAKTLAFDEGVNVTLGLPFVRTSPDHGTAFDIAGRGLADATSLVAALHLAARISA
ncbi:MAG: 4-hydroxythreonine-4-phosphate dehydrogenase PdxA [Pseudomonadota bacterium]|nr:4-hydroxythreonine-4-phosphate dehydrogenase PdxA [Pseudomonadota bacterium]